MSELKSNDSARGAVIVGRGGAEQQDIIFTKVEHPATYPGGSAAWENYLFKNLIYPQAAIDKELQGTVIVQFIVDQQGVVSDVKVIKAADDSIN